VITIIAKISKKMTSSNTNQGPSFYRKPNHEEDAAQADEMTRDEASIFRPNALLMM
jgi:hypothetical protein